MKRTKPFPRNVQQGFAAIAAIFLVVVLAALGGFMLTFSNTQQLTSAQDIQGTRAYWAARAGLEWALADIPATPAHCVAPVVAPPTPIEGFAITISCTPNTYTESGRSVIVYSMTVVARMGTAGTVGFIERSLSASMEQP